MVARKESGQMLVALLAFMAMAITLTTAATAITVVNTQTTSKYSLGQEALSLAEAGVENALIRLERDPNYVGPETLTLLNGTATINVSGALVKTIVSEGQSGQFKRKIQVTAALANNILIVTSWSEIP